MASPGASAPPPPEAAKLPATVPTAPKLGLQSISDVVFGLALSIGSIVLLGRLPGDAGSLELEILEFGFSFLIVFLVWLEYRRAVVLLPHETRGTTVVTVALLFCVSLEPFLFYVLAVGGTIEEPASVLYAVDVASMLLLLSTLSFLLLVREKRASHPGAHPALVERTRARSLGRVGVAGVFLVSTVPAFWTPSTVFPVRIDLWFIALALNFAVNHLPLRPR